MKEKLIVLVDESVQLEFDRETEIPEYQEAYITNMDVKMDLGIILNDQSVANPDLDSRIKFVAQSLANGLSLGNDKMAAAMCTYLGIRRPELLQVKITSSDLGLTIDLDYENAYQKPEAAPQVVTFDPSVN